MILDLIILDYVELMNKKNIKSILINIEIYFSINPIELLRVIFCKIDLFLGIIIMMHSCIIIGQDERSFTKSVIFT